MPKNVLSITQKYHFCSVRLHPVRLWKMVCNERRQDNYSFHNNIIVVRYVVISSLTWYDINEYQQSKEDMRRNWKFETLDNNGNVVEDIIVKGD